MIQTAEMTRRKFWSLSTCTMATTVSFLSCAQAASEPSAESEAIARKYYKLWETNDWAPVDQLLASTFTFTSAAGDDHISKSDFKKQCWDTQIGDTKGFDLLQLLANGNSAFVLYLGHTKNGHAFRNVEFMQIRDGKVASIECYFGQKDSFPSGVSTKIK